MKWSLTHLINVKHLVLLVLQELLKVMGFVSNVQVIAKHVPAKLPFVHRAIPLLCIYMKEAVLMNVRL